MAWQLTDDGWGSSFWWDPQTNARKPVEMGPVHSWDGTVSWGPNLTTPPADPLPTISSELAPYIRWSGQAGSPIEYNIGQGWQQGGAPEHAESAGYVTRALQDPQVAKLMKAATENPTALNREQQSFLSNLNLGLDTLGQGGRWGAVDLFDNILNPQQAGALLQFGGQQYVTPQEAQAGQRFNAYESPAAQSARAEAAKGGLFGDLAPLVGIGLAMSGLPGALTGALGSIGGGAAMGGLGSLIATGELSPEAVLLGGLGGGLADFTSGLEGGANFTGPIQESFMTPSEIANLAGRAGITAIQGGDPLNTLVNAGIGKVGNLAGSAVNGILTTPSDTTNALDDDAWQQENDAWLNSLSPEERVPTGFSGDIPSIAGAIHGWEDLTTPPLPVTTVEPAFDNPPPELPGLGYDLPPLSPELGSGQYSGPNVWDQIGVPEEFRTSEGFRQFTGNLANQTVQQALQAERAEAAQQAAQKAAADAVAKAAADKAAADASAAQQAQLRAVQQQGQQAQNFGLAALLGSALGGNQPSAPMVLQDSALSIDYTFKPTNLTDPSKFFGGVQRFNEGGSVMSWLDLMSDPSWAGYVEPDLSQHQSVDYGGDNLWGLPTGGGFEDVPGWYQPPSWQMELGGQPASDAWSQHPDAGLAPGTSMSGYPAAAEGDTFTRFIQSLTGGANSGNRTGLVRGGLEALGIPSNMSGGLTGLMSVLAMRQAQQDAQNRSAQALSQARPASFNQSLSPAAWGSPGRGKGLDQVIRRAEGGLASYVRGGTSGQDDKIPALLSDGEYIVDADVVSALGDGNNEAGAKRLDQMRMSIRKHKRSAPASKIPPKAKAPEQYLKGAR